jgi:hypothetical protein
MQFTYLHRKINISDPSLGWEHEQFALRKIGAATLSQHSDSRSQLHRTSLFDTNSFSALPRNIKYIAESLARYIYDDPRVAAATISSSVFEGSLSVDETLVQTWAQSLTKSPRIIGMMPKDFPLFGLFYKVGKMIF